MTSLSPAVGNTKLGVAAVGWLIFGVLLVYLAPYLWFEDSSRPASLIRISLFMTNALLFVFLYRTQQTSHRHRIALLNTLVAALLVYLLANTLVLSADLQPARRLLLYALLFCPFLLLRLDERVVHGVLVTIAVVSSGFALYSLINQAMQGGLPAGYRQGGLIGSGTPGIAFFHNTIVAAMHYAIGFSVLVYLFFTETKRSALVVWGVLIAAVSIYIILTFARSAWITCLVSFTVMYALTFNRRQLRFYVVPAILLALLAYFAVNYLGYELKQRGLTHRDEIWRMILSRMDGHWLFGYGLSTPIEPIAINQGRQIVRNSHNVYLEIVYQTGLLGLLLYLSTLLATLYVLIKAYVLKVHGRLSVLFLALLSAVSVVMLTELNSWIHTPNLLWMWLWGPIAVALAFEQSMRRVTGTEAR